MPPPDLTIPSATSSGPDRDQRLVMSWVDLIFCAGVIFAGFWFLRDAPYWARNTYVGGAQYGDAEFWWNGALHFSHGIIAENPNLTYRMGYAAFGGLVAAVCGPDYRVFHQILLGLFLLTSCGLYCSLRQTVGRLAAAAAVLVLVFNPFTAEWIAVSTSDGLGMILNLAALLALVAGVRGRLRLGWIALFGVLFSCGSLTRPLMTLFIVPAALAVLAVAWRQWRSAALGLGVMLVAFLAPTVAWMSLMAVTTGNFALTGASQDSSAFYAASDPQIQVWRGDMYAKVRDAAKHHFKVEEPSAPQINAEFWNLTRENYRLHWRYHLARLGPHTVQLAGYTHERSAYATPGTTRARLWILWSLVITLLAVALWERRWIAALLVGALGWVWVAHPLLQPWAVLAASALGLIAFCFGQRPAFLWATFWWVGVFALYLIGGTWGPPLGPTHDLNALGYRLGFQFFFVSDLLVIGALGMIAQWTFPRAHAPAHAVNPPVWARPSRIASRIAGIFLGVAGLALLLILGSGAVIVGSRLVEHARTRPVAYPEITALAGLNAFRDARPTHDQTDLMVNLNAHAATRLLVTAMSSGFVWNQPGQQRAILLLYRQDFIRPVQMNPRRFDVEVSQQLPEREWMGRQGAWVVRSFPDTAQVSNLPYYLEMAAVQAFIPLTADGKAYDPAKLVVFPLAKSATQLVAVGDMTFAGTQPEWSTQSGTQKYARRFALRRTEASVAQPGFILNLEHARGHRTLRFGVQLESPARNQPGVPACTMKLAAGGAAGSPILWTASSATLPADVQWNEIPVGEAGDSLRFSVENLRPDDTLWFYELVLKADDFTK